MRALLTAVLLLVGCAPEPAFGPDVPGTQQPELPWFAMHGEVGWNSITWDGCGILRERWLHCLGLPEWTRLPGQGADLRGGPDYGYLFVNQTLWLGFHYEPAGWDPSRTYDATTRLVLSPHRVQPQAPVEFVEPSSGCRIEAGLLRCPRSDFDLQPALESGGSGTCIIDPDHQVRCESGFIHPPLPGDRTFHGLAMEPYVERAPASNGCVIDDEDRLHCFTTDPEDVTYERGFNRWTVPDVAVRHVEMTDRIMALVGKRDGGVAMFYNDGTEQIQYMPKPGTTPFNPFYEEIDPRTAIADRYIALGYSHGMILTEGGAWVIFAFFKGWTPEEVFGDLSDWVDGPPELPPGDLPPWEPPPGFVDPAEVVGD